MAEQLPIACWRVEWADDDPRDPGNWVQWHDAEEMPAAWDDEPPTEMLALTAHAPAQAALDELRAEVKVLRQSNDEMQQERRDWEREVEALRADAERFRHLPGRVKCAIKGTMLDDTSGIEQWRTAIDTARAAGDGAKG